MNDRFNYCATGAFFGITRRRLVLAPPLIGLGIAATIPRFASAATHENVIGKGTPKRGGVLNRRLNVDPPSFDTLENAAGVVMYSTGPCYNGLVRYSELDPEKIVPDLAESYEISPNGLAYTFTLRKGVNFHDGKPFTAEDVKFTFDVLRDPPKGYVSVRAKMLGAIESIVLVDPHVVRFQLKRKSPSLIANLAVGWMMVLPKHILEKGPMKEVIVGTGPYKFKEYKRGVSIELVRNPDYHIPGRPYLDAIKFFVIPDDNTAYNYFRTGQLDEWVPSPALARTREKELAAKAYLQAIPSSSIATLTFNTKEKPFDDPRVRQAICIAIDRQEALQIAFGGEGTAGGFSMPGRWALPKAQVEKISGYGPFKDSNLAQAKALLAEAGFPNGFSETMLVRRIPLYEPLAIYFKDRLLKIGVDMKLDFQETAKYQDSMRKRLWKIEAGSNSSPVNDPDAMYADSVTCEGASNVAKLCDQKLDELVLRQSQELDEKKRLALVHDIESKVMAQYGTYVIGSRNRFRLYQNNVHGWGLHPNEDNAMRQEDCWKS
jgi:peptide/nickel transport system substrate-binding protein